jgi:hypothetical protein
MKTKHMLISLVLGLGLSLILVWVLGIGSGPAVAAPVLSQVEGLHIGHVEAPVGELHVCPSGCAYSSIQAAVDAALIGDVIKVAASDYNDVHLRQGTFQMVYISKTVTIRGGYTTDNWDTPDPEANPTTLDAQGEGRVFYITDEAAPTIEGLRITGGDATGLGGGPWGYDGTGGGVYVFYAAPTISNCAIYNNVAGRNGYGGGGGVYLWYSPATLANNTIYSNTAGMSTTVGLSGEGGGVAIAASGAVLIGNVIRDNVGSSAAATGLGGGLYMEGELPAKKSAQEPSSPILHNNIVRDNTASLGGEGLGGGIFNGYSSNTVLINTVLIGNVSGVAASSRGTGIYVEGADPHLLHTTFQNNTGGDGSGVYVDFDSTVVMTNTILVNQTAGVTVTANTTATLNGVLWYNNGVNTGGAGTINVTNEFIAPPAFAADGYHLMDGSAAIDEGVEAGVTDDIDGQPRPYNDLPDLGADEWHPSSCIALESVSIDGPMKGSPNTLYIFNAIVAPTDATRPITYNWTPDPEIGQETSSPTYKWTEVGVYTITLTAENCGGVTVSATHTITIEIAEYYHIINPILKVAPCASVYTITNQGNSTATMLHEFYDTDDQEVHVFDDHIGSGESEIYYLEEIPEIPEGYRGYVAVTADQPFTYTFDTCPSCVKLESVTIAGPASGRTNTPYEFTAVISPVEATEPISYTWIESNQPFDPILPSAPGDVQGASAAYTWTYPGDKFIHVTVENCVALATATAQHKIRIGAMNVVSPGVATTITYTNEAGYTTTLEFPVGAVTRTTTITYTPLFSPTYPISAGLRLAGNAFDLDAYCWIDLLAARFSEPVTLTIHYSDADIAGIDESTLALYRWIGWLEQWRKVGGNFYPGEDQWLDAENNLLVARLRRFSRFGKYGVTYPIFLPLVLRNY